MLLSLLFFATASSCADPMPVYASYTAEDQPCTAHAHLAEAGAALEQERRAQARIAEEGDSGKTRKQKRKSRAPLQGELNLNTASATQLQMLPGIGPSLANRVIEYREKRPFKKIDHVRRVKGIGKAKFKKMKAFLKVDGQTTLHR